MIADRELPRKQRHTARRIWQRLPAGVFDTARLLRPRVDTKARITEIAGTQQRHGTLLEEIQQAPDLTDWLDGPDRGHSAAAVRDAERAV